MRILSALEYNSIKKHIRPCRTKDISGALDRLREIKDPDECRNIRKACEHTSSIYRETLDNWAGFRTESDVSAFIVRKSLELGLMPSFNPIVASGSNAAIVHHTPDNRRLKRGFCIIDMGVKFENYCADMTRTVFIGKPTRKELARYRLVKDAQETGIALAAEGARAPYIDNEVRKKLGRLSKYFIHSTGHHLGLEIHENPGKVISGKSDWTLRENMAVTVEPGIYVPGRYGIRIEDTLLVKKKTPLCLTKPPKELACFPPP